jgi:hypothetical protein
MTKLSPAAQAVWDAYNDVCERVGVFEDYGDALAAALRAAADQVVPDEPHPELSQFWDDEADREWQNNQQIRRRILAIAAELDGTNPTNQED